MIFTNNALSCSIMIEKVKLKLANSIKFLGIYIDRNFSWQTHVNHVKTKISRSLYIMNRVKHQLSRKHLKTLYFSMVDPYLRYGLVLWYNTKKTLFKSLRLLQKKAIRIIHKESYNAHTAPLFKQSKILNLNNMYELTVVKYTYKCLHDTLPIGLSLAIKTPQQQHNYETRQGFRINFRPGFLRSGREFWDNIPSQIQMKNNYEIFCKMLNRFLVNRNDG